MRTILDEKGAAKYTNTPCGTLRNKRAQGGGPPFIKAGRRVLYDTDDLDAWLDSLKVSSTSEATVRDAMLARETNDTALKRPAAPVSRQESANRRSRVTA